MQAKQLFKSKTLNFNVFVGAAYALCQALGWEVSEEVLLSVATVGNFILRFFTDKPLTEK